MNHLHLLTKTNRPEELKTTIAGLYYAYERAEGNCLAAINAGAVMLAAIVKSGDELRNLGAIYGGARQVDIIMTQLSDALDQAGIILGRAPSVADPHVSIEDMGPQ